MKRLTVTEIKRAFSIMGEFLRDNKTFGEIAVYGGSAILLQFDWRESTEDVDATVVSVGNHGLVRKAADKAASDAGLERSWLSEAVAQYTSTEGDVSDFSFEGLYPEFGNPGLRVVVARPEYLLAMKLAALQRRVAGDRDFEDAKNIAVGLGIDTIEKLEAAYRAYFPKDELPDRARLRLPALEDAIKSGKK
jgi:hypothetical protein